MDEENQLSFELTLGEKLCNARKQMSLDITDVAFQLRVSAQIIERIETDGYLPEEITVFVRGYIRGYARLVNIPAGEVDQAFKHWGITVKSHAVDLPKKSLKFDVKETTAQDKPIRVVTYVVVVLLVLLVLVWHYMHSLSHKQNGIKGSPAEVVKSQPANQTEVLTQSVARMQVATTDQPETVSPPVTSSSQSEQSAQEKLSAQSASSAQTSSTQPESFSTTTDQSTQASQPQPSQAQLLEKQASQPQPADAAANDASASATVTHPAPTRVSRRSLFPDSALTGRRSVKAKRWVDPDLAPLQGNGS